MSEESKRYRAFARTAVSQLLAHKGKETVKEYRRRINASANDRQISIILADAREAI